MSNKSLGLSDELHQFVLDVSVREPEVLRELREETARHPESEMQIAPEQGQFMALMCRLIGARRTLEVGVYTGYSSLSVGLVLPEDGQVVGLDIEPEYTKVAERYWEKAGIRERLDLRHGPAEQLLDELLEQGEAGAFDFAFIDADKTGYDAYYERCLQLVRSGGLIALDNMLRDGRVANPSPDDTSTQAIVELSQKLRHDERVDISLVPIADGVTLARKK